jgi:hypothetical protein
VSVDVLLLLQYFYYAVLRPPPAPAPERAASRSHEREASHYRTLSVVAAHVAASAARAAQHEEARSRQHARGVSLPPDDSEMADPLAESVQSVRRKHVAWPQPLSPVDAPGPGLDRGRSPEAADAPQRRSSRASRRGATLVFMGAWALFGVGTLARARSGAGAGAGGRVLAVVQNATAAAPAWVQAAAAPPPSTERVIGRISAWTCTTLYLTSRLPQIWKNVRARAPPRAPLLTVPQFVRKSVEGLSIALFVCAFLGNTFYVGSILTSPPMSGAPAEVLAFLMESLPCVSSRAPEPPVRC